MKLSKPVFFFHPFLFALFPVLFLYSHNIEKLSFPDILISILLVSCFSVVIFVISKVISRDSKKSSLIASLIIILFFSYGYTMEAIYKPWLGCGFLPSPSHKYLLAFWIVLLSGGIYLIKKTRRDLFNLNKIITVISIFLIISPVTRITLFQFRGNYDLLPGPSFYSQQKKPDRFHDIYYIILDEYTSSANLKRFFNFDNKDFIQSLEKSGFYIAGKSHSNYSVTYLSLASSLNMEYVNYLGEKAGKSSTDWEIPYNMVKNNNVTSFLKSNGYQFLHFSSRYDATDYNKNAAINYSHTFLDNFSIRLAQTTLIRAFFNISEHDLRENILYTFSELNNIYKLKGKKFVFAHIVCPHVPFLFDKNGKPADKNFRNDWKQKEKYIDQLQFINKKVDTLINNILSKSENPPLIIIQGDHGTATGFENFTLHGTKPPSGLMIKERMGILNAYYLPGFNEAMLYDSITPVNTFRLIFNTYFHTSLTLLKDRNYFSHYDSPYDFTDVTGIISKNE